MINFLGDLLSPGGERGRLAILIYHRALAAPDPVLHDEIHAARFEAQMKVLAARFNVIPLSEAVRRLDRGTLPPRAASVTFDDGYADNERVALPILSRLGLQATFFVAVGYTGSGIMFNDAIIEAMRRAREGEHDLSHFGLGTVTLADAASRRAAVDQALAVLKYRPVAERNDAVEALAAHMGVTLPRDLMMGPGQIRALHRAGMDIGAHTVTHPILACARNDEAREEIAGSRRLLEEMIDAPVTLFAYPNGKPGRDYGERDVRFVKEAGYEAAVATIPGVAGRRSDPFQLPRYSPWEPSPARLGVRLLAACARPVAA